MEKGARVDSMRTYFLGNYAIFCLFYVNADPTGDSYA